MTVEQAVAGPTRRPDWEDARFLERFWFDADAQRAPIGLLSGGERRRLQLVLTLREKPNVLLLDEPTNDLDLDTLRVLEDVLEDWPGAVVVVSHDRAFLERTVTDVLVIDEHHPGRRVPGGFGAWEAARHGAGRRAGGTARRRRRRRGPTKASTGPSPSTLGRQLRDTEKEIAVAGTSPRSPGRRAGGRRDRRRRAHPGRHRARRAGGGARGGRAAVARRRRGPRIGAGDSDLARRRSRNPGLATTETR